ncbi:MAG TPA: PorV/PorQ family protein [Rhodothermales bacterium]|nr:hypothetical protein [Bacteroidota bacterium]HRK72824.1 PorV/PorQ family protein [Rhodothermales bacterium]HRR08755.1 PorV/PorQ family protein [Rhodothermales bacterium]
MKLKFICAFLLLFLVSNGAFAQEEGTTGSMHLMVPTTARTIGLGSVATTAVKGMNPVEAMASNPSGLSDNTGTAALFSRMNYVADIGISTFGVAQNLGTRNLALTFTAWNFGDIARQTEAKPEIEDGVTYSASTSVIGVSYSRQLTDRIATGVTFKASNERIDDLSQSRVTVDGGMTYTVGESGLRFGVALLNFGPKSAFSGDGLIRFNRITNQPANAAQTPFRIAAEDFESPAALNFGATYTRSLAGSASATLVGNFRSTSLGPDVYTGGVELGFRNLLFVRGGYQGITGGNDNSMYTGLSAGAGLNIDVSGFQMSVDYAYRATNYFTAPQTITVGLKF